MEVQRQTGSADCGLFAIVFVYSHCCGFDPHTMHFDQMLMRPRYESCIDAESFPTSILNRRQAARARCLYMSENNACHNADNSQDGYDPSDTKLLLL